MARVLPKQKSVRLSVRIALVIAMWIALLWGVWTGLRPDLGDAGGFFAIGQPNWFLMAAFALLLWILSPQLSKRIPPIWAVLGALLLTPSVFSVRVAASELHEQFVALPQAATVVAVHERVRDDSGDPKPMTFRFADGTRERGFSSGSSDWDSVSQRHSYPGLGEEVLVGRDPWQILPTHEVTRDIGTCAAAGIAVLFATPGVLAVLLLGGFSISVLTRRESALHAAERGEWGEKEKDPLDFS
ncbi:hypothetical protein CGZ95_06750 [Enemella evansiae]|uniref:hypothetical protein n=1 Tax=Enemella evansiae TaxID=2016499 RepID=UPI000B975036|nr:hypothetical protein [Enemella evansiae]OYO02207.1 hypothetical protein CGZ95_06750 [Enemella evansiae]